ncbi:MAG: hypothetical protein H0S85_10165 [Desulfovibrionaceae bacterium]|jgi:hypothetical protein|nr:hypothetical protein [Desulfovibrionaceae bacterium]
MSSFIDKLENAANGTIHFHYRDREGERMPEHAADPLALLGDISKLRLGTSEREQLREILRSEIRTEGPEAVWSARSFRKNVILSFGQIV